MDRPLSYQPWDVAEMAHEVASPLTAVTLHLESLQTQLKCCEHCQKYVPTSVMPTLSQLLQTQSFLQTYLQTETREFPVANVQIITRDVVDLVAPIATGLGVRIEYHRQQGVWWRVSPYFFRQILLNTLNNALETYHRRLDIHRRQIVLTTKICQQKLVVTVEDWAGGFGKTNPDGHGIGLKSVQDYLQRSRGELRVSSMPDQGVKVVYRFAQPTPNPTT